jgi:hypothetical protein
MTTAKCIVEGCESSYETSLPTSADFRYVCSKHDRKTQVSAIRTYDKAKDEADKDVKFQRHQFDKSLARSISGAYDGNASTTVVKFEESLEKFGQEIDLK